MKAALRNEANEAARKNVPAIMGMAAALEEACNHIDENATKLIPMRNRLIEGLNKIPYSILNGDAEKRLPGNVNFCFEGIERGIPAPPFR